MRRLAQVPMPGRGRSVFIKVVGASNPVVVRLGTSDIFVANEIFGRDEYGFVAERLTPLSTIIDLGANVGLSLRYWRQRYPSALIIGVEPDRENLRLCRLNASASGKIVGRTFFIRACAGGTSRWVRLNRAEDAWAFQMGSDANETSDDVVPVLTMPQILARAECSQSIDLLKCDIEGGEEELFRECGSWIGNVRNIVVEIHPPYTPAKLTDALAANGADFKLVSSDDKGSGLWLLMLSRRLEVENQ